MRVEKKIEYTLKLDEYEYKTFIEALESFRRLFDKESVTDEKLKGIIKKMEDNK